MAVFLGDKEKNFIGGFIKFHRKINEITSLEKFWTSELLDCIYECFGFSDVSISNYSGGKFNWIIVNSSPEARKRKELYLAEHQSEDPFPEALNRSARQVKKRGEIQMFRNIDILFESNQIERYQKLMGQLKSSETAAFVIDDYHIAFQKTGEEGFEEDELDILFHICTLICMRYEEILKTKALEVGRAIYNRGLETSESADANNTPDLKLPAMLSEKTGNTVVYAPIEVEKTGKCYYYIEIGRKELNSDKDTVKEINFTKREREIVKQIVSGKSYKEIADDLFISQETLRGYAKKIYKKSGIHNQRELMRRYKEMFESDSGREKESES